MVDLYETALLCTITCFTSKIEAQQPNAKDTKVPFRAHTTEIPSR